MTDPKPNRSADSTRDRSVTWSRCTATGTAAALAIASTALPIGARPPWYRTVFSLTWRITGAPAAAAPVTIAEACSSWITLKAPTPRSRPTISAMDTNGMSALQHQRVDEPPVPGVALRDHLINDRIMPAHHPYRRRHRVGGRRVPAEADARQRGGTPGAGFVGVGDLDSHPGRVREQLRPGRAARTATGEPGRAGERERLAQRVEMGTMIEHDAVEHRAEQVFTGVPTAYPGEGRADRLAVRRTVQERQEQRRVGRLGRAPGGDGGGEVGSAVRGERAEQPHRPVQIGR